MKDNITGTIAFGDLPLPIEEMKASVQDWDHRLSSEPVGSRGIAIN
jgi:hypothetical protein